MTAEDSGPAMDGSDKWAQTMEAEDGAGGETVDDSRGGTVDDSRRGTEVGC